MNSRLEKSYYLTSGRDVRAAISWLNDGDYTLADKIIGKDYDLRVYAPNGTYLGGSTSGPNAYEIVNFHTNTSGYYKFVINEYANRDTSTAMNLGLSVSW